MNYPDILSKSLKNQLLIFGFIYGLINKGYNNNEIIKNTSFVFHVNTSLADILALRETLNDLKEVLV